MSLQIGYIICFANTTGKTNIIYWFLIKCKWFIYSILATELYGMAHKFDIKAVINATLGKIQESAVSLILYTNSKFLYNYLVK